MSEWKEYKLGEIADLVKDKYLPKEGDTLNYVGLEHIQEQALRLNSIGCSDDVISAKFKFKKGDILFGKLRPYFRKVIRPNFDGVCSTDIWVVRAKRGINQEYLFYLFASKGFVDLCSYGEAGTRMPRADWNFMSQTVWNIPVDQSEQRAIASVLSSLDDKIDLLHRENKTLEAMAETLFRQWFIEEAKDEWEEVKLGDFFPVVTGKKNANFATSDGSYPFFTCSQSVLKAPSYSFNGAAILLAGNGDFNIKHYIGKFEAYQRTYVLMPYDTLYFGFLLTLMKYYLFDITKGYQGSVIDFITKPMIEDFVFLLPKRRDLIKDKLVCFNDLYRKVDVNISQIHTLEKLRDTLLPKLMSGEVRVKYEEEEMASCRA